MQLGELRVEVIRKEIKHIHLSVMPPTGSVRIAAPAHLSEDALRAFAVSKLGWIRQQQRKLQAQPRETPREYLERESHYVWGRRLLLRLEPQGTGPAIEPTPRTLILRSPAGADATQRDALLQAWYRAEVRAAAAPLIQQWTQRLGVEVRGVFVQRMKTQWGSCNPTARTIRLNTDLAKKPPECLAYVILHELAHLIEPTHGPRFTGILDAHLPTWRAIQRALNDLPVSSARWQADDGLR